MNLKVKNEKVYKPEYAGHIDYHALLPCDRHISHKINYFSWST